MDNYAAAFCIMITTVVSITINCIGADVIPGVYDVLNYGAVGDGTTDDTLAFIKAWIDTCNSTATVPTMLIPAGKTYFVYPMNFTGPCRSSATYFTLSGVIVAPNTPDGWKGADLLAFRGVNGLTLNGSGLIDGHGKSWWDVSCRHHPELKGCIGRAPTALMFQGCKEVHMDHINVVNTPQTHILVWGSEGVYFSFIKTDSPGTSPNTDGIHIQDSQHVEIHGAELKSGDDCISIGDYCSHIYITDVSCGPGHGISIGSLGNSGNEARVENITVHRARFYGTQNGARIKTWVTGKGLVRGVSFVNLTFTEVGNPIIIDQHYFCHEREGCHELSTAVQIRDVSYSGAVGTSISEVAINLNCSTPVPCTGITLENIQLASADPDMKITSSCHSVHAVIKGIVEPPASCLYLAWG